eukprot:g24564.t1
MAGMTWHRRSKVLLPMALLLCQMGEVWQLLGPARDPPHGRSARRATSGDPASIGIVEPLVNQLPRQERETFMGLLRFLSLPVDDFWFSAILLILVRFQLVKRLVMASQQWRRWLTTYCRRLRSQEDTIRLSGGGWLRQGARLVSPTYVGDVLELGGFENQALNTQFLLCKSEGLQHGHPVYQSRNKEFLLSCAATAEGKVWIVSPDEKFQQAKNQGTPPEGWPLKRLGALLVSPVGAHIMEAPQLNWQETELFVIRRPTLPLQVRLLPPTAPSIIEYSDSYVQAVERPVVAWATCFLILEAFEWIFLRKASTKSLSNRIIKFMSRLRWLLTSSCVSLALFRLSSRWKERRSRGKAVISDVLGVQSSQREARLSALTILMQTLVLCSWWIWVLAICGIKVGRLLLSTSVGALLLGFVGRDVLSNMLSCLVIYLTQPFAQGDWITLEQGQDGWAEEIGLFYTNLDLQKANRVALEGKVFFQVPHAADFVIQWDKRPLYVPNFRIVQMLVQNNSRMTNRRIRFDFKVRLQDIPKIPAIVKEIEETIKNHPQIDGITHRLVGWREVGDYFALIWLSCYTKSTEQDIKLSHYISVEQSILERCTAIIYKHGFSVGQVNGVPFLSSQVYFDGTAHAEAEGQVVPFLQAQLCEVFSLLLKDLDQALGVIDWQCEQPFLVENSSKTNNIRPVFAMLPVRSVQIARAGVLIAVTLALGQWSFVGRATMTAGESKVNLASYNGFVPDLQRRQLMNVVLVSTAGIPVLVALGAYLWLCLEEEPHLAGHLRIGDGTEDEWFVVHLLQQLTFLRPDVAQTASDEDGTKTNAALAAPRWVSPSNAENRCWLRKGLLHLLPRPGAGEAPELGRKEGLARLRKAGEESVARGKMQKAIQQRLEGYPKRALELSRHDASSVVRAVMPKKVARLLLALPQLISVILDHLPTPPSRELLRLRRDLPDHQSALHLDCEALGEDEDST